VFRSVNSARVLFACLSALVPGITVPAVAQIATGDIAGFVRDPSGDPVPNAKVTAKMVEQQAVRST